MLNRTLGLFFILFFNVLTAKPIVDLRDYNISNTSSIHKYSYDRPDFMWMCYGKNSHVVVLSDLCLGEVDFKRAQGYQRVVAYLMEPRVISPQIYEFIDQNIDKFDLVLTFDEELLERYPQKCHFVHAVGGGSLYHHRISKKTKLCSIIKSDKNSTEGHQLRHAVYERYKDYFDGYKGSDTPFARWKDRWTNDYRFQVVIENSQKNHYFTEKITECLRAGTIPIYWGCSSIGEFFDLDGIIVFNSIDELEDILKGLSEEEYEKRFPAVRRNFDLVRKYPECNLHMRPELPDAMDCAWHYLRTYF